MKKITHKTTIALIAFGLVLGGCTAQKKEVTPKTTTTSKGPKVYQSSGTLRCSVDTPAFDDVCGYRTIQKDGTAEIWITDIAHPDEIRYRVLFFDGERFSARNGEELRDEKTANKRYKVNVGREHYLISHRSLTEGYKY
jgi:hypothetical protein